MGSPFSPSFLGGEPAARAFLPDDFRHATSRAPYMRQAAARRVSAPTLAAMKALAARLAPSTARVEHLDALARPDTAVVVTGQQVGLFTGPLYAFYKAASAIAVARALTRETGVRCVPVFWLQSEDHDLPEIDHCAVHTREGAVQRVSVPASRDERRSVSSITLGAQVGPALDTLTAALDGLPYATEVLTALRAAYRPEAGWVDAFAQVLGAVFADEGLLFLDPRDPAVVREVRGLHERCFEDRDVLSRRLLEREAALEAAGFEVQVKARPGVPLPFVHAQGFDGPRERLASGTLPPGEVFFSSSALLRPVVQDTLLPTAAIVGGPGELNYFAQVAPVYAHFGVPMPLLVPRARFRVVDARTRAKLTALQRTAAQLERPRAEVLASLSVHDAGLSPADLEARLLAAVAPVLAQVPAEQRLGDAVERTQRTVARAASRLALRYGRALAEGDAVRVARVDAVQQWLFPQQAPQERVITLPSMWARYGLAAFKQLTFAALDPFGTAVQELLP